MRPFRLAVIGAGYFSQFHISAWQRLRVCIDAICDTNPVNAQRAAETYPSATAYDDLERMLDEADVDLLDVVVPPAAQRQVLTTVLDKQVPVICQKPFCESLQQARAIAAAYSHAGVPLIVHENFRFSPWYRHLKQSIEQNKLGRIHHLSFRLRPGDGQGPDAYLNRQPYFRTMERFLIHETGIHFVDTFRYLAGDVTSVYADLARLNDAIRGEDSGVVIFGFANGSVGVLDGNRLNDHQAKDMRLTMGDMWLEGSEGTMRLDGDGGLWWKPHLRPEQPVPYARQYPGPFGGAVTAFQAHVIDYLKNGSELENDATSYLTNLVIEDAIYKSNSSGNRVSLEDPI